MKKNSIIGLLIFIFFIFQSSVNKPYYHRFPPTNCTGAPNGYTCGFCHSDFAENMAGGGISIAGIPSTFVKGNTYPFSINIHHFTKDRKKFGYDIVALDALGNKVGSFGTSNPYSILGDSEITSNNPPILSDTDRTTIGGFYWTAPDSTFSPNRLPIKFYFCGNACNSDGKPIGDYVYNDSLSTTIGILPIEIERFVATRNSANEVQLSWSFGNKLLLKYYVVQKSLNGTIYLDLDSVHVDKVSYENNYSYQDNKAVGGNICIKYRIKSISKDGSISYSSIQVVQSNNQVSSTRLYPNPVARNSSLTLSFSSNQQQLCNVSVFNLTGKLLFTAKQTVVLGYNTLSIPIAPNIPVGTYFSIVSSANTILTKQTFLVK